MARSSMLHVRVDDDIRAHATQALTVVNCIGGMGVAVLMQWHSG